MNRISTFAKRLKEYRLEKNLTLQDLSKKTNIPTQTLNRYELNQRTPKVDIANSIAECLNIDSLWLQGYDISKYDNQSSSNTQINEQEGTLLESYRSLNEEGQEKATEYIEMLDASGKYKKDCEFELGEKEA